MMNDVNERLDSSNETQLLHASRALEEAENLALAMQQLDDVFVPQSISSVLGKAKDPLQKALTLIGYFMKINFVFPRSAIGDEAKSKSIDERLDIICQASHIQKRKLILEKDWWQQNHGSLLGFTGDTQNPVSIIRLDRYKIVTKERNEYLNSDIATELLTTGYMFYRSLEPSVKSGRGALAFFFKNYYKELIKIIPISVLGVVFALFPPIATNLIFSYAIPRSDTSLILFLTCGLFFSAIGFAFFYLLQGLVYLKMEGLGSHLIQTVFWDRLLKLSPRFFRRFTVGNLFSRIFSIEEIRAKINSYGSSLAITTIFAVLYLGLMLYFSPMLGLVAAGFAAIGLLMTFICCRAKIRILKSSLEIDANLRGTVIEMLQGIEKVRVAGVSKSAFSHWAYSFAKNNSLKVKIYTLQNTVTWLAIILPVFTMCAIYTVLMQDQSSVALTLPHFLAFNIAFGSFAVAVYPLNTMLMQLADVVALWDRTKVILEEPLEAPDRIIAPLTITGDIRVENIIFGYQASQPPILKGVSITIKPKQYVGIVGRTGCGKSTLIRLMLGFEKPQSGVIFYDGMDMASLDLQAVRRQLGVVLQGGSTMGGSIYEILSSGGTYTEEDFNRAIKLSGFDADLEAFPMGYNTIVPMNATTLSGGQKQRLLLAAALIGNPSVLIFDEATSSLDNKSQDLIVKNLEKLPVTRIAIAQRLSTIRNADNIYVLDQGLVVQAGTFEELANQPGIFADMLAKQTKV
jgi:NHLM bacteriocin system ABC transporter ATP-binding protein